MGSSYSTTSSSSEINITPSTRRERNVCGYYTKGRELGRGGCGTVYEGRRISDGLPVALKFVKKWSDDSRLNRGTKGFMPMEVWLMDLVNSPNGHSNVVALHEWFEGLDHFVMVLELPAHCMDLSDFCSWQNRPLDEEQAKYVTRQLLQALLHCQECGVFHRDVKPANILVTKDSLRVILIDFGCGDLWRDEPFFQFEGTRKFMPPEWFMHRMYSAGPTTVWSVGVTLFVAVCGYFPFNEFDAASMSSVTFWKKLPSDMEDFIRCCLTLKVEDRPTLKDLQLHPWLCLSSPEKVKGCVDGPPAGSEAPKPALLPVNEEDYQCASYNQSSHQYLTANLFSESQSSYFIDCSEDRMEQELDSQVLHVPDGGSQGCEGDEQQQGGAQHLAPQTEHSENDQSPSPAPPGRQCLTAYSSVWEPQIYHFTEWRDVKSEFEVDKEKGINNMEHLTTFSSSTTAKCRQGAPERRTRERQMGYEEDMEQLVLELENLSLCNSPRPAKRHQKAPARRTLEKRRRYEEDEMQALFDMDDLGLYGYPRPANRLRKAPARRTRERQMGYQEDMEQLELELENLSLYNSPRPAKRHQKAPARRTLEKRRRYEEDEMQALFDMDDLGLYGYPRPAKHVRKGWNCTPATRTLEKRRRYEEDEMQALFDVDDLGLYGYPRPTKRLRKGWNCNQ